MVISDGSGIAYSVVLLLPPAAEMNREIWFFAVAFVKCHYKYELCRITFGIWVWPKEFSVIPNKISKAHEGTGKGKPLVLHC